MYDGGLYSANIDIYLGQLTTNLKESNIMKSNAGIRYQLNFAAINEARRKHLTKKRRINNNKYGAAIMRGKFNNVVY